MASPTKRKRYPPQTNIRPRNQPSILTFFRQTKYKMDPFLLDGNDSDCQIINPCMELKGNGKRRRLAPVKRRASTSLKNEDYRFSNRSKVKAEYPRSAASAIDIKPEPLSQNTTSQVERKPDFSPRSEPKRSERALASSIRLSRVATMSKVAARTIRRFEDMLRMSVEEDWPDCENREIHNSIHSYLDGRINVEIFSTIIRRNFSSKDKLFQRAEEALPELKDLYRSKQLKIEGLNPPSSTPTSPSRRDSSSSITEMSDASTVDASYPEPNFPTAAPAASMTSAKVSNLAPECLNTPVSPPMDIDPDALVTLTEDHDDILTISSDDESLPELNFDTCRPATPDTPTPDTPTPDTPTPDTPTPEPRLLSLLTNDSGTQSSLEDIFEPRKQTKNIASDSTIPVLSLSTRANESGTQISQDHIFEPTVQKRGSAESTTRRLSRPELSRSAGRRSTTDTEPIVISSDADSDLEENRPTSIEIRTDALLLPVAHSLSPAVGNNRTASPSIQTSQGSQGSGTAVQANQVDEDDDGVFSEDSELEELMVSFNEEQNEDEPVVPPLPGQESAIIDSQDSVVLGIQEVLNESFLANPPKLLPYYLQNIRRAIGEVQLSPFDSIYLNDADNEVLETFMNECTDDAQMLYARLLTRNHTWIAEAKMNSYGEIQSFVCDIMDELKEKRFAEDNAQVTDIETLLKMLNLNTLRALCKDLKMNIAKKDEMINSLIAHSKMKCMFQTNQTPADRLRLKIRQKLPPCYRLCDEPRNILIRVLLLNSLTFKAVMDNTDHNNVLAAILARFREMTGQVVYPKVPLNRSTPVYPNRDYLIKYCDAVTLENKLQSKLEKKKPEQLQLALPDCLIAENLFDDWMKDSYLREHDLELPTHLRRFSCVSMLVRAMGYVTDIYERLSGVFVLKLSSGFTAHVIYMCHPHDCAPGCLFEVPYRIKFLNTLYYVRMYEKAVQVYEKLLISQKDYGGSSQRGRMWDRLALVLDSHLKDKPKALAVVHAALNDNTIREGHKLGLMRRAQRLLKNKACHTVTAPDGSSSTTKIKFPQLVSAPVDMIDAVGLDRALAESDRVNIFVSHDGSGIQANSVEEVAKQHYLNKCNFTHGVHAEGSVLLTLYGLLFWDIIYQPRIPDTFFSTLQTEPLDFQTPSFYSNRSQIIETRLSQIRSNQGILDHMENIWNANKGTSSFMAFTWDLFNTAKDAYDLLSSIGLSKMALICEKLAKEFKNWRSGLPDLTLWNPDAQTYLFVEVKGPGDKLSDKQTLWLDFFVRNDFNALVCYVQKCKRPINSTKSADVMS